MQPPDNVHLFILAWFISVFQIVCLPHADKYILHSRPPSSDWSGKARWKWRAHVHSQVDSQCSSVMSALWGSPNQPIGSIVDCSWTYVGSPRSVIFQSVGEVFGLATDVPYLFTNKPLWSFVETSQSYEGLALHILIWDLKKKNSRSLYCCKPR